MGVGNRGVVGMWRGLARLYFTRFPIERGKWRAWRFAERRLGELGTGPRVMPTRPGFAIEADPDDYMGRAIQYWGLWEPNETRLVAALLAPGDTFVDVGANIGWFTLLAARRVGPRGGVVAIEATPDTLRTLEANLRRNGVGNVALHGVAVGERDGTARIHAHGEIRNIGRNSLIPDAAAAVSWEVPARRLDDLLRDVPAIRLIKMDIEGAEGLALRGAAETLARPEAPDLLIEVVDGYLRALGSSAAEVFGLLRGAGYQPFLPGHAGLRPAPDGLRADTGAPVNLLWTRRPESLAGLLAPAR